MAVGSDNVFPKLILSEGAAPATPAAGQTKLYAKANGLLYWKDDAGTEYPVGGGGLVDQGAFTYLDATEAAAPATPAAAKVRLYAKADGLLYSKDDAGVETVVTGGAGGGGVASPFWWHSDNAPGSPNAANREFTAALGDTRVSHGTPKGTWAQTMNGAEWTHTVTLAAGEMDVYAIARTCSIGDYVTIAASYPFYLPSFFGPFVGFSNGTTFGTSNAVGPFNHFTGNNYRMMANSWPGHNSRATDGSVYDEPQPHLPHGYRVKYEAANTWGFYVKWGGGDWKAVQTNYAYTMTPTHVVYGIASNGATYAAANGAALRIECFRVND